MKEQIFTKLNEESKERKEILNESNNIAEMFVKDFKKNNTILPLNPSATSLDKKHGRKPKSLPPKKLIEFFVNHRYQILRKSDTPLRLL